MNVLSLFDGMSCGQIALERSRFKVGNYYSSEIDSHAIKITQSHFPNTIQIGNVLNVQGDDFPNIDLIMGGSPCQGFSSSGKMLNFEDPRSRLFFQFVRLLDEMQPEYFMLENVAMKKEYQDVITKHLGVEPVIINSNLVSAQNRKRLYWANFEITQPLDSGVDLIDILDDTQKPNPAAVRGRMLNKAQIIGRRINNRGVRDDYNKGVTLVQCLEVRATNTNKSNCLTTVEKDNVLTSLPVGRHVGAYSLKEYFRYYTLAEYCRLQTLPEDYFEGVVSDNQAKRMIGNGWTVDVIAHILNCIPK